MEPDRMTIYLALAVVACGIAAVTGPSLALISLFEIVLVVEAVNLISAPGDAMQTRSESPNHSQGE